MAHEGNHTLGGLVVVAGVKNLGHEGNVNLSILQQGHTQLDGNTSQIVVVQVAVGVVGKVLDIVDHTGIFLARNHLQ